MTAESKTVYHERKTKRTANNHLLPIAASAAQAEVGRSGTMKITDNIGSPLLDRITLIACGILFLFLGVNGVHNMRETFLNYSSVRISSAWYAFAILPPLISIGASLLLPTQYLIWKKGLLTNGLLFACLLSSGTAPLLYIFYDYEHNIHMTSPVTQEGPQPGDAPNPRSPSALAFDSVDLLGKPFTMETAISLWPSNSVIQTQRRKFRIEPANMGNPIWTQEAYLVDRQGIDDNSIWYQEPVVEYDVSTNPSNKVGVLTGIRLYMNATNQEPVRAFLARYQIATPLLTNMCMRFPNQVWTGVDEVTFHEDRTLGISNLPVRVFYRFEDGRLNRVTVALPLEESGLCRSVAVGAHISSDSVIDLPFLRRGGAVHVLGEHDMLLPDDKDKNIKLEKMRKLKEDDRAIAGEKIFEHLKGPWRFPCCVHSGRMLTSSGRQRSVRFT